MNPFDHPHGGGEGKIGVEALYRHGVNLQRFKNMKAKKK